jgi:hypothetical protein
MSTFCFVAGRSTDDFVFSVPNGWTFEAAAMALAPSDNEGPATGGRS